MSVKNFKNKFRTNDKAKNWGEVKFNPVKQLAAATPWREFKNEMSQKPDDGVETVEEKSFKKMREQNYKKMLMEEKRKEPTTWETFKSDKKEIRRKKYVPERRITEKDLESFDAKKLSFQKKNHVRKVVTGAISLKHNSLERAVENLKSRNVRRNKPNPFA